MIVTHAHELYAAAILFVVLLVVIIIISKRPKKVNVAKCLTRWQELQKNCANKKTWYVAIIDADKLLDDVLKRRHYKGKTTGERLVAAQRSLNSNDTVWFGHKLRNQIVQDDLKKISKRDTLEALSGFRRALIDLGALHESKAEASRD